MSSYQKVSEDVIRQVITVEEKEALQKYHKVQKGIKDMRDEVADLKKDQEALRIQGKKGGEQWKKNAENIASLNKRIKESSQDLTNLRDKLSINVMTVVQLKRLSKDLTRELEHMSAAANPEEYSKLSQKLADVKNRIKDLNIQSDYVRSSLKEAQTESFLWGTAIVKVGEMALSAMGRIGGKIVEVVSQSLELAESADGVQHAFEKLDNGDQLLAGLRKATKGTVNDLELMKAVMKAKDFKIPLEDLGKLLSFAQLKAQQTGQSVDYMVDSIVTGLGRKSKMILDNLGISAAEIDQKMQETGDFAKAVASIVDTQLAEAGEAYVSAADRALKRTTDLQNAQLELGKVLLPYKEQAEEAYGATIILITDIIKWTLQHKDVIGLLVSAVAGLTVAQIAHNASIKENIIATKGAAAASLIYKNVLTTLKGISLLTLVGINKLGVAMKFKAASTVKATAAMRLFNIACKANVIGLLVTGLVAAVTYFTLFSSSADKATKKTKELSDAEKHLQSVRTEADGQLRKDISTLKNFNGTKKQEIELVKQMNSRYGETIGYYKTVSEWYDALIKNSKLYCDQMVIEAQTRQIANQIAELEEQKHQIRYDDKGNKKRYSSYRETHHYMTGQTEVLQSDADKAQAKYNDLDAQSKAQRDRLDALEKQRLANAKKLHTGATADPYSNTTATSGSGSGTKEDSKALSDYKLARQKQLDAAKATYEAELLEHKRMLAEKKITKQEYDTWALSAEVAYKDNILKTEQQFYQESQNLSLKDAKRKQEIQTDQERNVQKAVEDSNQAKYQAFVNYQESLQALEDAGMSAADREKADRDAQLAVLKAYYEASLSYAQENGESVLGIVEAYAAAIQKLNDEWAKSDSERHFRARSSAGITTDQEEHQHAIDEINSNTELSPEEKNQAIENLEREHQQRLLQIRQQYGIVSQQELFDAEMEQLAMQHEQGLLSEEEYEEAKKQMKMQKWQESFDYYHGLFSNAVSALQDAEMANVDAKYDAEIEAARKAGKDTTKLEEKKAQEKLEIQKKYADINFAIKASQIIADTATSIMKAYADLGPIAGSIAAALMGVTGIAQLAAANAEREKVKRMTLKGGSSSSSATGERVATGKEEGGYMDVEREQDGKRFHAKYDPRRRGFVDRPTVIVGEGPAGQSKEWIASNAAVENPTVRPVLDVLDQAQRAGTVRTLDLNKFLLQQRGFAQGGNISSTSPAPVATLPQSPALMERFISLMERLERNGIPASVALDEIDRKNKLLDQSRNIGSK